MIGIDVGGTKSLGVLVDDDRTDRARRPGARTRRDAEGLLAVVADLVGELEAAAGERPCAAHRRRRPARPDRPPGADARHAASRRPRGRRCPRCSRPARGPAAAARSPSTTTPRSPPMPNGCSVPAGGCRSMILITLGTGIGGGVVLAGELQTRRARFRRRVRSHDDRPRRTALCLRSAWMLGAVLVRQGLRSLARAAASEGRLVRVLAEVDGDIDAVTGEAVEEAAGRATPMRRRRSVARPPAGGRAPGTDAVRARRGCWSREVRATHSGRWSRHAATTVGEPRARDFRDGSAVRCSRRAASAPRPSRAMRR